MNNNYKMNSVFLKEFGKMIKERCLEYKVSEREVGRELDVSNSTIARHIRIIEDDIKMSNFMALCKYFKITDEEIIYLYNLAISNKTEEEAKNDALSVSQERANNIDAEKKLQQIKKIIDN